MERVQLEDFLVGAIAIIEDKNTIWCNVGVVLDSSFILPAKRSSVVSDRQCTSKLSKSNT
jgi:hypothetical protein